MELKMSKNIFLKIFGCMTALAFLPAQSLAQQYQTLGPKGCSLGNANCHAKENPWWSKDDHFSSAKVFKNPNAEYQAVAQKYGISLSNAAQVNKECMDCHGTVISGKATLATDGVSCESCHGPGSGYKDPHQEEGKGYANGIKAGMIANKDLNVRAKMCVDCHYISEQKLIDADHPKGSVAYDYYLPGMKRISAHWLRGFKIEADAALRTAFGNALKARGATPVEKGPPRTPRAAGGGTPAPGTSAPKGEAVTSPAPIPKKPKAPKPPPVYVDVIEPPSKYQTLGPKGSNGCGLGQTDCHASENDWWVNDEKPNQKHLHFNTYRKFLEPTATYAKYLKKYGIEGDQTKINQICMKCHGTVITAKADKEVTVGVSCESCHGPGSDYREPHDDGDLKDGLQRTGYIEGLKLGMVENKNLSVRAQTCARCHYITEQKLIALTGHSTGEDFEYFDGMQQLTPHWKPNRQVENEDSLKATYARAMQAKGPPLVQDVDDEAIETQPEPVLIAGGEPPVEPPPMDDQPAVRPVRNERRRPIIVPPINLRRFETVVDTTSLQKLIITLKRRLEELSKAGVGDQP
jgi:hypothetical protein